MRAPIEHRTAFSRRRFLQLAGGTLVASGVAEMIGLRRALAASAGAPNGRKKRLIVLWMEGGPSQLDTFDPKPGTEHGGPFRALETAVKGVRISEHLPQLAREAGSFAIVRSLVSREGNHPRARHLLHTGYSPGGAVHHPSLGAVVSHELARPDPGAEGDLPSFVSINGLSSGSGFFGAAHAPFLVDRPGERSPNLELPEGVDADRFARRLRLLDALDGELAARVPVAAAAEKTTRTKALRMMRSEHVRAFDLSDEPDDVRRAYGDNAFGRGVLVARRLVEAGVSTVEVALPGWDTHADNFDRVRELSATLDPAMATLLADLRARGLFEDTLVVWMGEMGRTPRINERGGRDHFTSGFSAVLAGAGVRGGRVVGRTSDDGTEVKERPVTVPELFATIYRALGLDLSRVFETPAGRPLPIVADDAQPVAELL